MTPAAAKKPGPPHWFRYGAALVAFAILIALGSWQLDRRAGKQALFAARDAALAAEPLTVLPPAGADIGALEYHRIRLSGTFRHAQEMFIPGRSYRDAAGFHLLTPFVLGDGRVVIVNRGYLSPDRQPAARRAAGNLSGEQTIEGRIRRPFKGNMFTPDNRPDLKLWFTPDLPAIAQSIGVASLAPFILEAGPAANPGGWPIGGQTVLDLPNDHLQYALTWYALALVLAVIVIMLWRKERQEVR